ncbi:MAG: DUF484 family protein [Gammaproteobacteria bacterium]|nr:DUF484 family protein [Gammaproteobacteria bacterium]
MNSSSELEETIKTTEQDDSLLSEQPVAEPEKNEEQITADYLSVHPDFFNQYPALLASLEIAHASGSAVSLIERQVSILREQNAQHKSQLTELVEIAKENEQSNHRMHKLTLSLMGCEGVDACEVALDEILCDDFSVDAIALKLFVEPIADQPEHLFVQSDSTLGQELDKLLTTRKPMCGFFKKLPMAELFEEKSQSIASMAVLPLFIEKNNCFGALILGSQNVRRFNADMGTLFLERLSETLSHKLNSSIK